VAIALPAPLGRVTLDSVWFHYPDRDQDVLRDVSLEVAAGEVVALVGPSGAGKSTLVSLVTRFYDPSRGRILLDGVDLRDLDLRELRGHVGIVPQETHLFSGTIEENIRYGRPDATADEIRRAAADANAEEFILGFSAGYATIVGERGVKLSGGQRQRVAIARALLKNPRILILDEATSSLDSHAESLVQDALTRLMVGRTTFVIAHRLSTVRDADRVVVLSHGQIAQIGSHASLMAEPGLYRSLYERQLRDTAAMAALPT
jgi:subfamily B ATP-binding cassette protein MsbA